MSFISTKDILVEAYLERGVSGVVFRVHVLIHDSTSGCHVQDLTLCFVDAVLIVLQLVDADEAV